MVKPGRDYDVALVPREGTSWREICIWRDGAKERAWPYKLDVVDLTRAPRDFLEVVRGELVLLHGEWNDDRLFTEET
jgi:hypothetical protein